MYSKELEVRVSALLNEIKKYWENNIKVINIDYPESPYDEFEITVLLYNKFNVGFAYDRSTLDIGVKINDKYEILGKLTNEQVFRGFKSYLEENIQLVCQQLFGQKI